jgi:hypothetical protein
MIKVLALIFLVMSIAATVQLEFAVAGFSIFMTLLMWYADHYYTQ